jgi:hypothetical protein
LKLDDKMVRGVEVVRGRIAAVGRDAPIGARFEPEILRQAAEGSRHDEHVAGVGGLREQDVLDERRAGAVHNVGPTDVLHENEEQGLDIGVAAGLRAKAATGHQRKREQESSQAVQSGPRSQHDGRSLAPAVITVPDNAPLPPANLRVISVP